MKQHIREKIWKELGSYGGIPPIKKIDRTIVLLERVLAGRKAHFTETAPEKAKEKFGSAKIEDADVIVSGAVAASDTGACISTREEAFPRKPVIVVIDSAQMVETNSYDFVADVIVTPHYIINAKKVGGIDEAGRGCVIGPLVVGAVSVKECQLNVLKALGVKDSKVLSPERREVLAEWIKEMADTFVEEIEPSEIDGRNGSTKNLNRLEEDAFVSLIKKSGAKRIFADVLGSDGKKFSKKLELELDPSYTVTAEPKGDAKFPVVSAASIIAKVERDRQIGKLREKYGDFGSGYSHDPKTNEFLRAFYKKNKFFPPMVRGNWGTVCRIKGEATQKKLD